MNKAKKQINAARKKGLSPLELAQMKAIAKKHAESMEQEATEKAFVLMLAIPCLILGEDYWKKKRKRLSYAVPAFKETRICCCIRKKKGGKDLPDSRIF